MISRKASLIAFIFAVPLFVTHPAAFAAPDSAVVSLQPDQLTQFAPALKTIADQAKVTFVVEGFPIKPVLPPGNPTKTLVELPVEEAVAQIAALYDYEVAPQKSSRKQAQSIFVLKKRYSDPHDLPGVTLEEYALAISDISRVMKQHLPQPAWTENLDFVETFRRTLTPEQRQALDSGGKLHVALLSATQKAQVKRMTLNSYTGTNDRNLKYALPLLQPSGKVVVVSKPFNGQETFGYDFYESTYDQTVFRRFEGILRKGQFNADSNTAQPGDNAPAPDRKNVTWEGRDTLATAVGALQKRVGNATPIMVDPALAAKPVTVIGEGFAPVWSLLDALAGVYGLRVSEEKDGSLLLTRQRIRFAVETADLPQSVARLIPEPLLRSLRAESLPPSLPGGLPRSPSGRGLDLASLRSRRGGPGSVHAKATRLVQKATLRLKDIYDAQKNELGTGGGSQPKAHVPIPLHRLSTEGRSAFAVTVLYDSLQTLISFADQPVPAAITNFENGFISGGLYEEKGKQYLSLLFTVETDAPGGGKATSGSGITGLPVGQPKKQ